MRISTAQTIAAIANEYADRAELAQAAYDLFAEDIGFPGIWVFLGEFGLALDAALSDRWEEGTREFIDDVFDAADFLAEHTAKHGFTDPINGLVRRFINQ